ncbi:MAG: M13 family metallopeptidase [Novosphingobium sp.]
MSLALFLALTPAAAKADGEWGKAGLQMQYVDQAARPGDDFDRYVNGKWSDAAELPADKSRIGSFIELNDLSESRLHALLDGLVQARHPAGSPEARIAAAYSAFMNTEAIETAGLTPAKPWLDRIAAAKNRDDLIALFASPGVASPISAAIGPDEKQSDRNALALGQGEIGLPDRDYYLVDTPRYIEVRAKYLDYLTFLLGKAGYSDPRASAQAVMKLETAIARTMWDRTVSRNRDLTYNKLSRGELSALAPGGVIDSFIDKLGFGAAPYAVVTQVPPSAEELAAAKLSPQAAAKLGGGVPATVKLIDQLPLESWKAWLTTQFLIDHAATLPSDIDKANFAFFGTLLSGQPQQRPRWKRGINAVEEEIGELLGQVYAQRYFPAANRNAMQGLVGNLRRAMAANLAGLQWMGPQTRREALAKLTAFTPKIGAPAKFKTYGGLAISPANPLANNIAAAKWSHEDQLARMGKPVDRSEWFMLPQTVNAYYNSTFNEVVFPAAILQPPFFNPSADPAVNYGGIGAVIGHEMGHGFDDQGAKSDGAGNLRDWWTPADKAAFEALTGKLAGQYSAFCPFGEATSGGDSKGGRACVNGEMTLGENIGDLGGLSLAYRAYRMSLRGKPAPVIDGLTGDQRFFMSWAQVWRAKARDAVARQLLVIDPHSPPKYRINGIVRNFGEWYSAFGVRPGDKLYLPPDQRVRIW